MKATSLIGADLVHATDPSITGTITDIVFNVSLERAEFYLADVGTDVGTAPLLFSPTVLAHDNNAVTTSAHPDDITARVKSAIARLLVPVDPGDLPSTLIGPFGNTISPSMLAALFNARSGVERPELPGEEDDKDGLWFETELKGHAVRAHVGNIGTVVDAVLDEQLTICADVIVTTDEGHDKLLPPHLIKAERGVDSAVLMSLEQTKSA